MHKLLLSLLPLLVSPAPAPVAPAALDVSKIYGRIQYVDVFPDYTIEVVDAFPDLKVEEVNAFPDAAGKWEIVTVFPDYKIQKVKSLRRLQGAVRRQLPGTWTRLETVDSIVRLCRRLPPLPRGRWALR